MRKSNPVEYNDKADLWNAYRYDDVKKILTNHVDFSSDFTKASPPLPPSSSSSSSSAPRPTQSQEGPFRRTLISTDPPLHRYLRGTISSAFSATTIERLEPRIRDIANDMIDKVIEKGSMDLVRDFSYPLPVTVIAELLGIPSKDRDLFKRWADELLKSIDEAVETGGRRNNDKMQQLQKEMDDYFLNVIAEKRKKPGQDLVTQLINAETDKIKLSQDDILSFCALLLQAGHLTTVNLINNCMWSLLEHPQQLVKLKNNLSSLLTSAIEETLRYRSPVQALVRFATKDVQVGGRTIKSGQRIIPWIGSANRDEAVFGNPEEFDITRGPNPHIAFGAGIHLCLGAPLARLESHVAMEILLSRLQDLEFGDDPRNFEPIDGSLFLYGVKSLPLLFKARQH
ncbi:cytochrome P450 [Nitrososphaera viennensis]|uniref:Cytochrome P450 n=2 Tax=Nitrososphaera viennensis TaxID=1034015 RepID=A0A977ICA6_9ARCH|nr:cytochrome P450 [Nitrososphaera viennensis]AIC16187.1 putative cytochrome P450 YjiB [Nitrososphaera viennensis EN76]UVS68138.1 cytochrome P450 [Nitrososphaera viennensis]